MEDYQQTQRQDRQCDENLGSRDRRAMQMECNTAHHGQHESNRQRRCRAMRGRQAPNRNNRRQMVEADDRMTQT